MTVVAAWIRPFLTHRNAEAESALEAEAESGLEAVAELAMKNHIVRDFVAELASKNRVARDLVARILRSKEEPSTAQ